jgi:hypothetical protein
MRSEYNIRNMHGRPIARDAIQAHDKFLGYRRCARIKNEVVAENLSLSNWPRRWRGRASTARVGTLLCARDARGVKRRTAAECHCHSRRIKREFVRLCEEVNHNAKAARRSAGARFNSYSQVAGDQHVFSARAVLACAMFHVPAGARGDRRPTDRSFGRRAGAHHSQANRHEGGTASNARRCPRHCADSSTVDHHALSLTNSRSPLSNRAATGLPQRRRDSPAIATTSGEPRCLGQPSAATFWPTNNSGSSRWPRSLTSGSLNCAAAKESGSFCHTRGGRRPANGRRGQQVNPNADRARPGPMPLPSGPWLRPFLLTLTGCVAHPIHALPIVPRDHGETLPCNAPSFTGLRCKWFPTIVRDPSSYFQDFVDRRNDVVQFHLG